MTSDISNLIDDSAPNFVVRPRRRTEYGGLYRRSMRRRTDILNVVSWSYKREMAYIRELRRFVISSKYKVFWMRITRGSDARKVAAFERLRARRMCILASICRSLEAGWMAAWKGRREAKAFDRYYEMGAVAFHQNISIKAVSPRAKRIILRDNW